MTDLILFGEKKPEYYKDLLIRADKGLHEQVVNLLRERLPNGGKVLDMGAGQGALSERLSDNGFEVFALDENAPDFKSNKIEFLQINFNDSKALEKFIKQNENRFDAVVNIEVIEHVENQFELVRNLKRLVRPEGHVLITTPNITSWYSRAYFLRKGTFVGFDEDDLEYGHINPITPFHLSYIMKKCGLKNITRATGGTLPTIWIRPNITFLLNNIFSLIMRPFQRGALNGWCIIFTAQK